MRRLSLKSTDFGVDPRSEVEEIAYLSIAEKEREAKSARDGAA